MRFDYKNKIHWLRFFFLLMTVGVVFGCGYWKKSEKETQENDLQKNDLERIKEAGVLKAVIDYNSTNYFVYRGRPMGFQYELLQQLSQDLGVTLKVMVSNNLMKLLTDLKTENMI